MKKLTLLCTIERISLSDFGIVLTKGEKLDLTESEISSSPEILRALNLGGLVLHSSRKQPRLRDTSRRKVVRKPHTAPRKTVRAPSMEERIKGMIAQVFEENIEKLAAAVDSSAAQQSQVGGIDPEALRAMLNEAVGQIPAVKQVVVQGSSSDPIHAQVDDTPMFIPSGIVSSELEAEIDTASESSKGSSVDAATEALRQLRKSKKRKKES